MNILLIYPEFPDTFWSFKHALQFVRKKAALPPLGLLTIANLLPPEWNVQLVDMNVCQLRQKHLEWADLAFISAMTVQRESVKYVIERCRDTGTQMVGGGPLFTTEFQNFPGVDHFVLNEAEITLPAFIRDFKKGNPKRFYQTEEYAEIQESPLPRWDLIRFQDYATMSVQYSRGCPFNCDFCNVTALLGHRMRTKSSRQIIDELDGLHNRGWRNSVFFVDDNLIGNKKALKDDLLPALIEWRKNKLGFSFHTQVSINLADDAELMERMVQAGFNQVFIGIETPDEIDLEECSKRQNLNRDLLADVRRIQHAGMQVQGGFIVGFDNDNSATFQGLTHFIQQSGIATAMVGILQAPIGTALYERMKKAGRIIKSFSGDNVHGTTNIITKMDMDQLKERYIKLIRDIYSPKLYYQRVKILLKEYRIPPLKPFRNLKHICLDLSALLKSVVKLGIFGKERRQFWDLFFWTLFRKPRAFAMAITYAVYGYHFRKISEEHVI